MVRATAKPLEEVDNNDHRVISGEGNLADRPVALERDDLNPLVEELEALVRSAVGVIALGPEGRPQGLCLFSLAIKSSTSPTALVVDTPE